MKAARWQQILGRRALFDTLTHSQAKTVRNTQDVAFTSVCTCLCSMLILCHTPSIHSCALCFLHLNISGGDPSSRVLPEGELQAPASCWLSLPITFQSSFPLIHTNQARLRQLFKDFKVIRLQFNTCSITNGCWCKDTSHVFHLYCSLLYFVTTSPFLVLIGKCFYCKTP